MKAATVQKAARLVREGKVTELSAMGGGCRHWLVEGETRIIVAGVSTGFKPYYVTTRGERARCACDQGIIAMQEGAQPRCSHAAAALFAAKK